MSERVDVLAYLAGPCPKQQAARAAVAELIEADREYDKARAALDRIGVQTPAMWARLEGAIARRAAAIASVGGGA